MTDPYACSCVVIVISLLHVPLCAAEASWSKVTIRFYDNTEAIEAERRASLEVAASIVSAASVEVLWKTCTQSGAPSTSTPSQNGCEEPIAPGEFAVRIVRSGIVLDGMRGALPLGDAMIDSGTRSGVLATIYIDRVNWMAEQAGIDVQALLGRAIAHELGHLLMASGAHGSTGLMRPRWSQSEIRRRRMDDWMFRPQEIAAIKARPQGLRVRASQ
jgi:hypothetical protein